ncbi:MAG: hypothetical protein Q7R97_02920 [Candidatus Daviesbacteria bacterium]|nr:hypothetical protein [Candidatus Daviesbacteria bacterium]
MNERLSKGVRKHFRNELADIRDSGSTVEIKRVEGDVAVTRLSFHYSPHLKELKDEIDKYPTGSAEGIELNVKRFWIEYKISDPITRQSKLREIDNYLTSVEKNYPQVYATLIQEVSKDTKGNVVTRMIEIRNQVMSTEEFKKK